MPTDEPSFEWDERKNAANLAKHKVSFEEAQLAFSDPYRVILKNVKHSANEERFYCIGWTQKGICTVRYTLRGQTIRIIGAGYWREGRKVYEASSS